MLKDSKEDLSKFYLNEQKSVLLKKALLHTVWSGYMGCFFTSLMVQKGHKIGTFQRF